ncbi:hypothetical protein DFH07DRAFT_812740 [Mycena maculata]|uniref:Uncharacterized protein n=1 Tax=Mycena maculata TaxID=230809 RepID=A0AAD7JHU2_9AGAR|nr:hypothetical protein DFH07DRAFT_812740 [Mycena maculata]
MVGLELPDVEDDVPGEDSDRSDSPWTIEAVDGEMPEREELPNISRTLRERPSVTSESGGEEILYPRSIARRTSLDELELNQKRIGSSQDKVTRDDTAAVRKHGSLNLRSPGKTKERRRVHGTDFSHLPSSPSSILNFLGDPPSPSPVPTNTHSLLRGTQEGWLNLDDVATERGEELSEDGAWDGDVDSENERSPSVPLGEGFKGDVPGEDRSDSPWTIEAVDGEMSERELPVVPRTLHERPSMTPESDGQEILYPRNRSPVVRPTSSNTSDQPGRTGASTDHTSFALSSPQSGPRPLSPTSSVRRNKSKRLTPSSIPFFRRDSAGSDASSAIYYSASSVYSIDATSLNDPVASLATNGNAREEAVVSPVPPLPKYLSTYRSPPPTSAPDVTQAGIKTLSKKRSFSNALNLRLSSSISSVATSSPQSPRSVTFGGQQPRKSTSKDQTLPLAAAPNNPWEQPAATQEGWYGIEATPEVRRRLDGLDGKNARARASGATRSTRRVHADFSHLPPSSTSSVLDFLKHQGPGVSQTPPIRTFNVAHSLLRGTQQGWSGMDDEATAEALRKLDGISGKSVRAKARGARFNRSTGSRPLILVP